MAYYLGYRTSDFHPIALGLKSHDLKDLIAFTTGFNNKEELNKYLFKNFLINDNEKKLYYLIEKGPKGNKYYVPIINGEKICYHDSLPFFDYSFLRHYFLENKYDVDFYKSVLAFYLKKLGYFSVIRNYLNALQENYDLLKSIWIKILDKSNDVTLKNKISKIIVFENKYDEETNTIKKFKCLENYEFLDLYDDLMAYVFNNNCIVDIYYILNDYIEYANIPVINIIKEIYSLINHINSIGINEYEYRNEEGNNLEAMIEKLLQTVLLTYDKNTHSYIKKDGKYKISDRELTDIAIFTHNYDSYKKFLEELLNDKEKEEFLFEDDFLEDQIPEEEGFTVLK